MIADPGLPWGEIEIVYDDRPITARSLDATRVEWLRARQRIGAAGARASFSPQPESTLFSAASGDRRDGERSKRT